MTDATDHSPADRRESKGDDAQFSLAHDREAPAHHTPDDDVAPLDVDVLLTDPHVEAGGDAVEFAIGPHRLRKFSVGDMDNNVYVLVAASGHRLLVDAAAEPERIAREIETAGEGLPAGPLVGILTTHRHPDHVGALEAMVASTGVPTLAGAPDADVLPVPAQHWLMHGDVMAMGEVVRGAEPLEIRMIRLTGHTPGSVALAVTEPDHPDSAHPGRVHLLTGDSLFPGGPGKTGSPQDFATLMDDLEQRVFAEYGDDTRVYPGHGDDTLLGIERPHLREWHERGW